MYLYLSDLWVDPIRKGNTYDNVVKKTQTDAVVSGRLMCGVGFPASILYFERKYLGTFS